MSELRPEAHHNNTDVPDADETLYLTWSEGKLELTLATLKTYPQTEYEYSYTTDHGDHGPHLLQGVSLRDLVTKEVAGDWLELKVLSADGFGNRLSRYEVFADKPPMLYYLTDGEPLSRQQGLVRLVVPSETDNALRQIKWVREVRVAGG